jgi:hypothetical protein
MDFFIVASLFPDSLTILVWLPAAIKNIGLGCRCRGDHFAACSPSSLLWSLSWNYQPSKAKKKSTRKNPQACGLFRRTDPKILVGSQFECVRLRRTHSNCGYPPHHYKVFRLEFKITNP